MASSLPFRPRYPKNEEDRRLFSELRHLVYQRVESLPKSRLYFARFRAIALIAIYVSLYFWGLQQSDATVFFYLAYLLMGITAVLIFVNIIHESCHGNLFRSKAWNRAFYHFFDIMGMNSYIWKKRHNILHHNFPNTEGWDSDIEQSSIIKIYPQGQPSPAQRHQYRFFFLLYPLYLANWVIVRDFKDYLNKHQIVRKVAEIPAREWFKLILFKVFFITYTVIIPWKLFGFTLGQSVIALLIMLGFASVFALAVLLTPHVNTGNQFPLLDAQNMSANTWFMHQLVTTNDISSENVITRYLMGNFNYHIAHHLFPHISCVYAPEVTAVIREFAREHQLPYRSYPFWAALSKHYQLIKANSTV
jgi:linoleoyl-CoA desaturase